jgi:hypothetical protein
MRLLEVLARVQTGETLPLAQVLSRESVSLSWGTTLILIGNRADEALFDVLFQARRGGLDSVLVLVGEVPHYHDIRQRADYFGFPLYQIRKESDLDLWRK